MIKIQITSRKCFQNKRVLDNRHNQHGVLFLYLLGPSWSWSHCVWNYTSNCLCNQSLSPLTLWVWTTLRRDVLHATLCDKVCQGPAAGRWFSPVTPVSSTNKTDYHDITEILLKVTLNTIKQKQKLYIYQGRFFSFI
jgi:hypothetical protein